MCLRSLEEHAYDFVSHAFAKLVKRARMPRMRFHELRHTFASRLLMASVPLITVSRMLGYATINWLSGAFVMLKGPFL